MDKVAKYKKYIQTLLTNYASDDKSDHEIEVQLILDTERDHYQWMNVGWQGSNRIYRCIMHFDIRDGKIWLQQNLTAQNPAEELVAMGVSKEDIVLGLQLPYKRQYTEYGIA
ncbi:MAG: XisI protein [Nostoc sp.]|uniref:XisI protein n=1 Tax=Nostoc sp. TaxID=1180 RepID=UPI002FF7483C